MRRILGGLLIGVSIGLIIVSLSSLLGSFINKKVEFISPLSSSAYSFLNKDEAEKTVKVDYSPYTLDNLSKRTFSKGEIKFGKPTKQEKNYTTYVFTYQSDEKTISGMANIPIGSGPFPVIILLRGYADQKNYHVGLGTERNANFLADNEFITLAPDFLGYGLSDWESPDILLARFNRPVEVLSLLLAIGSLSLADNNKIGLWGHSNGGQIALSVLEITGESYPTSLWAPVSLGFPESVLTYLGEQEEVGNPVKEKVDQFLTYNNPRDFSISEYFNQIKSPFIIHQGTSDELIKTEWTQDLVQNLRNQSLLVDFYTYRGENHNFNYYKTTGETLRQRDLEFFKKWLGIEL